MTGPPGEGGARQIAAGAGNLQTCRVGRPFAAQLVAVVADPSGRPLADVVVSFRVTSGPATFGKGARVATARSGDDGRAVSAVMLAGERPGNVQVTATAPGVLQPARFNLRVIAAGSYRPGGRAGPGRPSGWPGRPG